MVLNLSLDSLDWALTHVEAHGDTDIFPRAFEFEAIRWCWRRPQKWLQNQDLRSWLAIQDISKWTLGNERRCLTPKHRYGFRVATQLDPLDTLVFTALVFEIGQDIECVRLPVASNSVWSSRFSPDPSGQMYDLAYRWETFRERCESLTDSHQFVVTADIADFFSRIYSHPFDNALDACTTKLSHSASIQKFIKTWNHSVSYGIPIGLAASRLLAELAVKGIDDALVAERYTFCRFVDDYRLFCATERDAHEALAFLARALFETLGLTLQQHKTTILSAAAFKERFVRSETQKEMDGLTERLREILGNLGIDDNYGQLSYGDLPEDVKPQVDALNLKQILVEHLERDAEVDTVLCRFILRRMTQIGNHSAVQICLDHANRLYPLFKDVVAYVASSRSALTSEERCATGARLLNLLDSSIVSHLEYHRMCVLNIFAESPEWNNQLVFSETERRMTDDFSRRKLILARSRAGQKEWFFANRRDAMDRPPWSRRAFLAGARCMPSDQLRHWYTSVTPRLNTLEKVVTTWALANPL